jgi:hypothetical protein
VFGTQIGNHHVISGILSRKRETPTDDAEHHDAQGVQSQEPSRHLTALITTISVSEGRILSGGTSEHRCND